MIKEGVATRLKGSKINKVQKHIKRYSTDNKSFMPSTKRKDRVNRDKAMQPNGKSSPGRYAEKARIGRIFRARMGESVANRVKGSKMPKTQKSKIEFGNKWHTHLTKAFTRTNQKLHTPKEREPGSFAKLGDLRKKIQASVKENHASKMDHQRKDMGTASRVPLLKRAVRAQRKKGIPPKREPGMIAKIQAKLKEAVASRVKGSKIPKHKKDTMRYGKHSSDPVVKNIHRHRALPTDGRDRPPGRIAYLAKFKKWQKARFGEAFEPTDDDIVKASKQVKKRSDKGKLDVKKATMDPRSLAQIGASIRAKGDAAKKKSMEQQDETKEPKLSKISKKLHKSYHTFKMSKADKEKSDEVKKEVLAKKGIKEEAPGMKFFQKIMKARGKDKKKDKKAAKKLKSKAE